MKLSRLLAFLPALIISVITHAETGTDDQVLVFLKSGAVEIFHHSDLKSIEMADEQYYTDHPDAGITQFFKTEDAVKAIAIADIDSVAFGNRDKVEINPDVMRFTQKHIDHLVGYDGMTLIFDQSTTANLIPAPGQKVYCDILCDQLPIGLCAVATSVIKNETGQTVVNISDVDISDIFDALLYVGASASYTMNLTSSEESTRKGAPVGKDFDIINIHDENMSAKGTIKVQFDDIVINAFKHVYSATITIEPTLDFSYDLLQIDATLEKEKEFNAVNIPIGTIFGVIRPSLSLGGFINLKVEGRLNLTMHRDWKFTFLWQRMKGESQIITPDHAEGGDIPETNFTKINSHISGEIFGGLKLDLALGVVGNLAGIIAENRLGPCIEGNLESELLVDAENNYEPQLYSEAKIGISGKLSTDVSLFYQKIVPSSIIGLPKITEEKKLLFNKDLTFFSREFPLFPQFKKTVAVPVKNKITATSDKAISVATHTCTETLSEIEPGFALVDKATNEIVDSVFVAPLPSNSQEPHGIESLLLPEKDAPSEKYIVFPVIKYDGHIIKAAPEEIKSGATLSPIFFALSKGKTRTVGGAYTVKSKTQSGITYIQGNPIKLIHPNPLFKNAYQPAWTPVKNSSGEIDIIGTWKGNIKEESFTMTFNPDLTGSYNGQPFTYECDVPDKGDISITISSDGSTDKFSLMSISDKSIKLFFHKFKRSITLTKQ